MGWNPCPASGRMYHTFDKATHRCACGRWERGHAPKKAHVKPRAECQICEREQARTANGTMGHHGYTRPGCGYQVGDCFGVGYLPYNATDALVDYAVRVDQYLHERRAALEALPSVADLPYTYSDFSARVGYGVPAPEVTVRIQRGDKGTHKLPSFESVMGWAVDSIKRDIANAEADLKRVRARIAAAPTWKPVT